MVYGPNGFGPKKSKSWAQKYKRAKGEVSKLKNVGCSKIESGTSRSSRQLVFLRSIYSSSLEGKTVAKSFYITFSENSKYSAFKRKESEERKCMFCEPRLLYSFFTINANFFPCNLLQVIFMFCVKFVSLRRFKLTCFCLFLYEITVINVC
jgi:hypothetical protein